MSYMAEDPHLPRFMAYLSIFTGFMLVLVTSDNYLQLFFGWEGIGLASYLLINFWITRLQANKAAIKAMLVNKIGDFGLALGILGIFLSFKTVDFSIVFACASHFADATFVFCSFEVPLLSTVGCLLFLGVIGKSAQIGLHTWLPCAMEGPTPVSALIHAATLVTAGVFLMGRHFATNDFANQSQIILEQVTISTSFLILLGLRIRAQNVLFYLSKGRLTNLILCQDLIKDKAIEVKAIDGIWNKRYQRISVCCCANPRKFKGDEYFE
jgi:NADH:ubiquinone oxidoreductase subunit 5 (subunit L)/multisubunit Na+/H+ antiporter MnhA subunit